jgi:transposase
VKLLEDNADVAFDTVLTEREQQRDPDWSCPQRLAAGFPAPVRKAPKIVDAIFYVVRGGIQWDMLPKDFPPEGTVYWYFSQWKRDGTLEKLHDRLRKIVRVTEDKKPEPTAGVIDRQSRKTTEEARTQKGVDAGKKDKRKKATHRG